MKTRRFVWSHPGLVATARDRFVPVAADDVEIRERGDRSSREWQILSRGTRGLPQQGMYAMTSSGIPLGYLNQGWPDPDPEAILGLMRRALDAYARLPREQRVLDRPIDPARDRMRFERDAFRRPPGTLALEVVSRGLPYPGMTSFDQRHPMYHHTDRLWFRPDEWRAFLPERLAVGAAREVDGPARKRIVLLSHMQAGTSAWWEEHLTGGRTVSRITAVRGDRVDLEIVGDYQMRADSRWCKDRYDGDLHVAATFDRAAQRWTRFDLAMLGTHTVGVRMDNLHAGDLTARVAATGQIAPEDGRIPTNWKYGYGLPWSQGR